MAWTDFFILAGRQGCRISMRNGCGFTTGKDGLVPIAVVRSGASRKRHGARFIARGASLSDMKSQWNPFDAAFSGL
jgi:hypothetical protein